MSYLRLVILLCSFVSFSASAQISYEVGGGNYSDDDQKTLIYSGSATYTTPKNMSFTLGYSGKSTDLTSNDVLNPLILQLNPKAKTPDEIKVRRNLEHSVSASVDFSLGLATSIGLNTGFGSATSGSSYWVGGTVSQWFRQDTLQMTANVTYTGLSQEPYTTLDLDQMSVTTLANLNGVSAGLQFYHLTTPSLILRGGYTLIQRSDRPLAHGLQLEGRYFMGSLNGSVHLAGTYYLNKGVIEPITLLGEVDANSVQVQWHQGLANRFVAMAGYRRYLETITPRVQAAPEAKTGSDYIHGSLRWLFPGDRPWTTSGIPELSLFGGFYIANEISDNFSEPNNGVMIGIAFKSALDLKKKKRKRRRPKGKYKGRSKSKKFKKDKYKRKKLYKKKR